MSGRQDQACYSAFGVRVALETGRDAFLRQDSLWRVREIYERFLGLHPLPDTGVAVDVGAGFGAFAVPFALAYPGWRVVCFEPVPASYDLLCRNVEANGLASVTAVRCAVTGAGTLTADLSAALRAFEPARIHDAAPRTTFRQNRRMAAFLGSDTDAEWRDSTRTLTLPAIPAEGLAELGPDLVKLVCPGFEDEVMRVAGGLASFIVGESWRAPAARHAFRSGPSSPHVYVPLAGTPLRLHRALDDHGRRDGLDVVVATYNARDWILECVEGLVANDEADIRAVIVDDGSTDGSGDLVRRHFGDESRVRVLRKPNGGCASARNFGRLNSDATHVAFVDADDFVDAALFPTLLELARYSGDPVTQGGFDLVFADGDEVRHQPSSEQEDHRQVPRHPFRGIDYFHLDAAALIPGQPTIWRRVYRRDFLDNRNVWFPEHIRAFDDQIFHMLSLHYAGRVLCTDAVAYHYRQHPGQDIRQGDERCFYSLEMYQMALKRAIAEGWNDFAPIVASFANTINWTADSVRPDLRERFLRGAAEIWVLIDKALGASAFRIANVGSVTAPEFSQMVAGFKRRYGDLPQSYAWAYMSTIEMSPDLVRASSSAPA